METKREAGSARSGAGSGVGLLLRSPGLRRAADFLSRRGRELPGQGR